MNRLVLSAILLFGWIILVAINRGSFFSKISAMPQNNINSLDNSPAPTIDRNLGTEYRDDSLENQISSELYNSISSGMSYEEVSSIIGWKGVLIYENKINNGGKVIRTKVYQWNYDDIYTNNNTAADFKRSRIVNPDKNLTLEFQDNILIEQTFSDLKP